MVLADVNQEALKEAEAALEGEGIAAASVKCDVGSKAEGARGEGRWCCCPVLLRRAGLTSKPPARPAAERQ